MLEACCAVSRRFSMFVLPPLFGFQNFNSNVNEDKRKNFIWMIRYTVSIIKYVNKHCLNILPIWMFIIFNRWQIFVYTEQLTNQQQGSHEEAERKQINNNWTVKNYILTHFVILLYIFTLFSLCIHFDLIVLCCFLS